MKNYIQFRHELENLTNKIHAKIVNEMPYQGDSEEDSQKICLLNALKKFEHCINGIEQSDFKKLS